MLDTALLENVNIDCHAPILQALMLIYFCERTVSFMPLFLYVRLLNILKYKGY